MLAALPPPVAGPLLMGMGTTSGLQALLPQVPGALPVAWQFHPCQGIQVEEMVELGNNSRFFLNGVKFMEFFLVV